MPCICIACASASLRKLHRYRAQRPTEAAVFQGSLYQCADCTLIQLVPLPTDARLAAFYRDDYRTEDFAASWEQTSRDELAASGGASGLVSLLQRYATPTRVLDVGAGIGHHSRAVQSTFPRAEIWCVEPDAIFIRRLRAAGLQVIPHGWPEGADALPITPDAAILSHVLEHVPQPGGFVQSILQRLAPGGVLAIEVPNDPAWRVYVSNHSPHLTFFTPESLRRVLDQVGDVLFMDTAGQISRRRRPLWQERIWQSIPRTVRQWRSGRRPSTAGAASLPTASASPWVTERDAYGGEERFAVRAIVRRR